MSFFVRNVKNKTSKLVQKRKQNELPISNGKKQAQNGSKKPKVDLSEEIPSDSDDEIIDSNDENASVPSDFESDDELNQETAQEKKLRLAKQYLEDIQNEQGEGEDVEELEDRTKRVTNQLRDDILEKSGKLKRLVAKSYTNGSVCKELRGHKLSTTCVVISNDSKYIFSGSKDGSIIKWDIETGKKLFVIKKKLTNDKKTHGHTDQVFSLAITTDFKFLASGGKDTHINIWDPSTGNHVYVFYGHRDAVSSLSFRQNTHQLYSASFDRSVKLWSLDEMTYIETLFGHQDKILSVDSLNKERCITCGARDRTIRIWKIVEESQLIFQGTNFDSIDCLCLVNDDLFLSGTNDGALSLWHISKKKPLFTAHKAHKDDSEDATWISAVAALHNTDLLASGSSDGHVRVWGCSEDFFRFEELFKIKLNGFVNDLKFSNDGQYLIAAVGQEHKLGRWHRIKESRNSIAIIKFEKKK